MLSGIETPDEAINSIPERQKRFQSGKFPPSGHFK
jgi:hypothetical protein